MSAMTVSVFTSCYDDSLLVERMDDMQEEIDGIKSDLAALKAAVEKNLSYPFIVERACLICLVNDSYSRIKSS